MKRKALPARIRALPLEERALLALRAAVKKAIAERLREGLPVYVSENGRVVNLAARKRPKGRGRRRPSKNSSR